MKPDPVVAGNLPTVANGQIMPGDVDRFSFQAKRGQRLVLSGAARELMPYLADAVPGWFQAVLALYDPKGNRVAFADDYRSNPDPVLFYPVPEDGEYTLEVHDSIFRGREDFVYRVTVSELPFITRIFPLGGRAGVETTVAIAGWNLPEKRLRLDTSPDGDSVRWAVLTSGAGTSNRIPYAVDTLPERLEKEPNSSAKEAQQVALPLSINGIVDRPGDTDVFRFEGRAGEEVVAEVYARRLGSPLNSLLRLTDASGRVLAWNDDFEDASAGLLTHHADSFLSARLPKNGPYFIALSDAEQQGDEARGYRLRIGTPRPEFALRVTPSAVNVPASGVVVLNVRAVRRDGFAGDIQLALKDAPPGFRLGGAWVPHGRDSVRVTLAATDGPQDAPVVLRLEGRAAIGGATVTRPALPATEMMQAFAYWHLVPGGDLVLDLTRARKAPVAEIVGAGPARVPAGGSGAVQIRAPWRWALPNTDLVPVDAPKGVTVKVTSIEKDGLSFVINADANAVKPGYADNLIVEAFVRYAPKDGKPGGRYSLGLLPAVPFEIVQPEGAAAAPAP